MTLFEIVGILKQIALTQPNVKSATDGSIYDIMNATNSVKYDVVHFSQTKHISNEETDTYGFNIFYVSRLEDSLEDNRLQIQSIGKEVLDNILRTFCENWNIDYPEIIFYPFTQKFADLCAGCYCRVDIEVPKEIICADDYTAEVVPGSGIKLQDVTLTIKQNGLRVITPDAEYDGIGEVRIVTDVPQTAADLEYKEVEYTENGDYTITPDEGYDGLSEVAVSIDVPDHYDEGYAEGKQDGIDEQKAKLTVTSFTQNNTYTRADGWSAVTVDVPQGQGYEQGYADGEAAQKAKLSSTSFTQNSAYTRADGWSSVTVDVDDRYDEGVADQKAKLTTLSVSANGEYNRADGYSAITVDVPQGQGYEQGYADGEAAQKAKLTTTSVTENGTYTRADGYSAITVSVPSDINNQPNKTYTFDKNNTQIVQSVGGDYYLYGGEVVEPDSGYTGLDKATVSVQANITDLYNSGYTDGVNACIGMFASAITLVVDSAITDNGTASTTYSPNTASYTDIHYSSSDPSIATIDEYSGEITVLSTGTVTICTMDRITSLEDCKQVAVTKTVPPPVAIPYTADTSDIAATGETRCVTIDTTGLDTSTIGLVYTGATGVTYAVSGNQVCITFPNNTGLPRTFKTEITATTLNSEEAYADITFNQLCTDAALTGALMIKYRVTSTTQNTQVVTTNSISTFASYAIYNGKAYSTNTKYIKFPQTGDLWVYYILKDPTTCPAMAFRGYEIGGGTTAVVPVEAKLPNTITTVGNYSFYGATYLSAVTLGESTQKLGRGTFGHCNRLGSLYIPSAYTGNTYMDILPSSSPLAIFADTTNTNVYYEGSLADWITKISFKGYATNPLYNGGNLYVNSTGFSGSLIQNLTIPSNVTSISDFAFDGCGSITSVTIHTGVTYLGYACFRSCYHLTGVTDNRTTPQTLATTWQGAAAGTDEVVQFYTDGTEYPIYVPAASVNTYKTAENWDTYANRITAITT